MKVMLDLDSSREDYYRLDQDKDSRLLFVWFLYRLLHRSPLFLYQHAQENRGYKSGLPQLVINASLLNGAAYVVLS